MTNIQKCYPLITFALGAILITMLALFLRGANTFGDSPGSLPANNSSTTDFSIGATAVRITATSTQGCAARIISTNSENGGILLTFNDTEGLSPTATIGHSHGTSSTVVYGAENFGCGTVRAISESAKSIPVTITETF